MENQTDILEKSVAAAIGMNLIIPGAGYIYMGNQLPGVLAFGYCALVLFFAPMIIAIPNFIVVNIIMALDMVLEKQRIMKEAHKNCPYCAEKIMKNALICRFCGRQINDEKESVS